MTNFSNQAGIPGGGLFNDIFDAHYRRGDNVARREPVYDFGTGGWSDDSDDELGFGAGCGLVALIFFVVVFLLPDMVEGVWFLIALFAVPVLIWKFGRKLILENRRSKAPAVRPTPRSGQPVGFVSPSLDNPPAGETYPSLFKGQGRVDLAMLKTQCDSMRGAMERAGNVPDYVDTSIAGFSNFFGAACEITTAKALRGIDGCFVVNDIAITKPDGRTTANIDHLACFPADGTYVMVDSKFWSTAPTFGTYLGGTSVDAAGQHARAVATCVYEASFLPHPPTAIVFAVRGKAAQALREPVSVDFYPTFDYEGNFVEMKRSPYPVLFVDHRQVREAVETLGQFGTYGGAYPQRVAYRGTNVLELAGKTRVGDNTLEPTTKLRF